MKKEKAMANGNAHLFKLQSYARYISRGTCDCGAVRFFADNIGKESIALAKYYNEKKGKEGYGHMVTVVK